jgi:hypothetical protein
MAATPAQKNSMIVVNLKGGLGNQLFQYAAGLALAEKHQTSLLFDDQHLKTNSLSEHFTKRDFELHVFSMDIHIAQSDLLKRFTQAEFTYWHRAGRRFFPQFLKWRTYRHESLNYDSTFSRLPNYTYIDGYFQSENYFKAVTPLLREKLTFRSSPSAQNAIILKQIRSSHAVSLHVRRGDYLSPVNQKIFGNICTPVYYEQAIKMIQDRIENAVFFIFSDDPEWAKTNIKTGISPAHYMDTNNSATAYEDLRLMSNCQHHIIANSSFSWWGAWLNPHIDKIVISPPAWIHESDCKITDVIPPNWVILN